MRIRPVFIVALAVSATALLVAVAVRGGLRLHPRQPPPPPMAQLLPWHKARLDSGRRLLPWPPMDPGRGYEYVIRLGWRRLAALARTSKPVPPYFLYATFNPKTGAGGYWQNHPAFHIGSFTRSAADWYAFSGDRRPIRLVRTLVDYGLAHGMTPRAWNWPGVAFTTSCGGAANYGGCPVDPQAPPRSTIEPDKVGEAGYGFLIFWELTGDPRYRRAAIQAGSELAGHVRPGDAQHTPWPFRVDARSGRTVASAEYGGGFAPTLELFDELVRLRLGPVASIRRARTLVEKWLNAYPLNPKSSAYDRWSRYAEDIPAHPINVTQMSAMLVTDYMLRRRDALTPEWRSKAAHLVDWTRKTFERGPFHGAIGIDEQGQGRSCCSAAGLGDHTARWAANAIRLAAADGDGRLAAEARRSLAYATYFSDSRGNVACCGVDHPEWWFSTGYSDYGRWFLDAMAADPALAPAGENHLLSSTSTITRIRYGPRSLSYSAFEPGGTEVLRLVRKPRAVHGGRWRARPLPDGDIVVSIQRAGRRVSLRL